MFYYFDHVSVISRRRAFLKYQRGLKNMRHVLAAATTVLIAGRFLTLSAFPADLSTAPMNPPAPNSLVPQSAFFAGLGGGWDSVNFGNQNVFGRGTSFTPPVGPGT